MSLNGLDTPLVQEAYQAAITEAGGWFLLKYTSRDSVELLGRGKGGVHEARVAIAKYEDLSPLYGLIIYRRRKVLIKYIPEGTSRLLQARTAVHFSDVLERYSPYETLLEITTADGLNDTSLAASFPLHTASPSASQNRLHEISEDGEDGGAGAATGRALPRSRPTTFQNLSSAGAIFGTQRYKAERRADQLMGPDKPSPTTSSFTDRPPMSPTSPPPSIQITDGNPDRFITPYASPLASPQSSVAPTLASATSSLAEERPRESSSLLKSDATASWTPTAAVPVSQAEEPEKELPQIPSQRDHTTLPVTSPSKSSSRTSHDDISRQSSTSKRSEQSFDSDRTEVPSAARENGHMADQRRSVQRPTTSERVSDSGNTTTTAKPRWDVEDPYDFSYLEPKQKVKLGPRPVAAGDKPSATVSAIPSNIRPSPPPKKEQARPKSQSALGASGGAIIPEPPPIPDIPPTYNPRPLSRGSIRSLPSHKSGAGAMTPDKIRLMKAVELRKKQLRKSQGKEQQQRAAAAMIGDTAQEDIPAIPRRSEARLLNKKSPEQPEIARISENEAKSQNKADSGIEMEYERKSSEKDDQQKAKQEDEETRRKLEDQQSSTSSRKSLKTEQAAIAESTVNAETRDKEVAPTPELVSKDDTSSAVPTEQTVDGSTISASDAVPTIVMADGSRPLTSGREEGKGAEEDNSAKPDLQQSANSSRRSSSSGGGDTDTSFNLNPPLSARRQNSDLARRRRGLVEPLQIDVPASTTTVTTPATDGELFLSDDELMEELQSATVQKAQSLTMSRTPTAAHFDDRRPSAQSFVSHTSGHSIKSILINNRKSSATQAENRASTSSAGGGAGSPEQNASPPRSTSESRPTSPESGVGLRRNVSSGITQRIQALTDADASGHQQQPRDYFMRNGQGSFKAGTASVAARKSAYRQTKRWSGRMGGPYPSASSPPAVNATDASPLENGPVSWNVQHEGPANRNSVSVTARIVRQPSARQQSQDAAASPMVGEGTNVDGTNEFQHSDLVINRQRASYTASQQGGSSSIPTSPTFSSSAARFSTENPYTARSASQFHSGSRSSVGRHHPSARENTTAAAEDVPTPLPASTAASGPARAASPVSHFSDDDPTVKESGFGGGSRTSRFFKRMSNFASGATSAGNKRRSLAQQQQQSQQTAAASKHSSIAERPVLEGPQPAIVGDLNVQFPDNLLWKRRWVEIDPNGNLVFSIPQAMDHQRGLARKFPLSQLLRSPYPPDLDRQELPHSVMLDFADGTTLQAAAEDAVSYRQVLSVLRAGYKAWVG